MPGQQSYRYTTLISSLPAFEPLASTTQTPISRLQLQKRLLMLGPDDLQDMEILSEILDWFRQPSSRSDEEFLIILDERLEQVKSEFVRECIIWRTEYRTIIAALRRKRDRLPLPDERWGYGRWLPRIRRHWHEPLLGMEKALPWVVQAKKLLDENQSLALEKLVLLNVWYWLRKLEDGHEFDFAAVVIYRMKWDLIARWTSYKTDVAGPRFMSLLKDAMATFDSAELQQSLSESING